MPRKIGEVFLGVRPDATKFAAQATPGLQKAGAEGGKAYTRGFAATSRGFMGSTSKQATAAGKEGGKRYSSAFGGTVRGLAASLAVFGGIRFLSSIIGEAREANQAMRLTNAVIKSTGGVAGVTAKHIDQLSSKMSLQTGVQDELIQGSQNLLLTFTKVRNTKTDKIFDQASTSIVDMTAAMNHGQVTQEGLKASTIQVGKALQDPIKGATALRRVGVALSQQQQDQIKKFVKSGDVMSAQKVILKELATEFGGAAKAAADPAQKAQAAWAEFKEQLGKVILPLITKLAQVFIAMAPWLTQHANLVLAVVGGYIALYGAVKLYSTGAQAAAIATRVWAIASAALSKAWSISPIGVVILAIAALVAVIIYAYRHSERFRIIVQGAWNAIRGAAVATADFFVTRVWPVMVAVFRAVGGAALWLWQHAIGPAFRAIAAVAVWLYSHVFAPYFAFIARVMRVVAAVAVWLYANVFAPYFRAIAAVVRVLAVVISWLYAHVAAPVFKAIGAIVGWLYTHIFKPYFAAMYRVAYVVGWVIAKVVWPLIRFSLAAIGAGVVGMFRIWRAVFNALLTFTRAVFLFVYRYVVTYMGAVLRVSRSILVAVFSVFRSIFSAIYRFVRSIIVNIAGPVFRIFFAAGVRMGGWLRTLLGGFRSVFAGIWRIVSGVLSNVRKTFASTVDAVRTVWSRLKTAVKTPVNFVIDPVYKKVAEFWNAVAGKVPGLGKLPPIKKMASGGIYPGYTPGRDIGTIGVSGGEAVMRPEWTRLMGSKYVHAANRAARAGYGTLSRFLGGFAGGGVVGERQRHGGLPIGDGNPIPGILGGALGGFFAKKSKDFVLGNLLNVAKPVTNALYALFKNIPGSGPVGTLFRTMPKIVLDALINRIRSEDVAPALIGGGWNDGPLGGAVPWIIKVMKTSHIPFSVTSTTRNEPGSYHGTGNAVDMIGPNMNKIAAWWYQRAGALLELIHSPSWFVKNGKRVSAGFYRAVYAQHFNHVHVAAKKLAMIGLLNGSGGAARGRGSLVSWINAALALTHTPSSWLGPYLTLIQRESGGNVNARSFSSNGSLGYARGLTQLLASTFRAYHQPGTSSNILDPVANIAASIRYVKARYGTIFNVQQAVGSRPNPGGYKAGGIVGRFDRGGLLQPGQFGYNGGTKPELMTPTDHPVRLHPADLKKLADLIGNLMLRGMSTFGEATARRANLLTR